MYLNITKINIYFFDHLAVAIMKRSSDKTWSNLRPSTLAEVLDVLINLFIITFARRILYHSYVLVSCSIKEKEVYKHLNMKMLAPEMCPNIEVLYRLPCPMPINPCIPFVSTKNNR